MVTFLSISILHSGKIVLVCCVTSHHTNGARPISPKARTAELEKSRHFNQMNNLAKLRRCVSRIHFGKIHFGKIQINDAKKCYLPTNSPG